MNQHSISINIFGRKFPMRVNNEEKASVLAAAQLINDQVSTLKSLYSTQDDLNIAIMCCLKVATDYVKQEGLADKESESVLEHLSTLEQSLDRALSDR